MKVYEVTLTPQQLATITVALAEAAEHAYDAAKDADDAESVERHGSRARRFEALWRDMGAVARDFTLVER